MANAITELDGFLRQSTGKGSSRKLRKSGFIPAVVYGGGSEALAVAVSPKESTKILQSPLRRNVMIHLNLAEGEGRKSETKTVMVRDLQIDPVMRNLTHLDFVQINAKEPIEVAIPLILFGKSTSVLGGGQLDQIRHTLKVKVMPSDIPVKFELDITDLEFGSTPASAVKLPAGVELAENELNTVVSIHVPREDKTAAAATTEAAAGAPAAGAPAAGAAPAKAGAAPAKAGAPAKAAAPAKTDKK